MRRFTKDDGLPGNSVRAIAEDKEENIWVGISAGVAFITPSGQIKIPQGLTEYEGDTPAITCLFCDSAGRIWFTLIDGFTVYDPVKIMTNPIKPIAEITTVDVDGRTQPYNAIAGSDFVLNPDNQRFTINFTGLTFVAPELMEFSYMLEGFEMHFSDWNTTRSVSYTNLKPGTYRFLMRARTDDDVASELFQSVYIIKKPHIWELWYFWFTIIMVVLIGIAFILANRFLRMKRYQEMLEKTVQERTQELRESNHALEIEKGKSEALLLKIFPAEVAQTLTQTPDAVIAESYPMASVLFADIVGFTKLSSEMNANAVVNMLNELFSKFDARAHNQGIEKIKTIGDCYMAACGLSVDKEKAEAEAARMIQFAKGLLVDIAQFNATHAFNLQLRIGINTGVLVAGVIGKTKFLYDIWGDTVNVASRMESSGIPGQVHVTETTHDLTKGMFAYGDGTVIQVKGKGDMQTYFLQ